MDVGEGIPVVVTLHTPGLDNALREYCAKHHRSEAASWVELNLNGITLPEPRPISLVELQQMPLTTGVLIVPPLSNSLPELPLHKLMRFVKKRQIGVLDADDAQLMSEVCQPFGRRANDAALVNVCLTPEAISHATRFAHKDATNSLISHDAFSPPGMAALNNDPLLLSLYLMQRWGRHVRVIGQPDELDTARFLSNMPRLKSIRWEHPPGPLRRPPWRRVVSNGVISYGVSGLQGLALGHMLGPSVRLCIDGAPLGGLAHRLAEFVSNSSSVAVDEELRAAVSGLRALRVTAHVPGGECVTPADMQALKRLMLLASPHLEALVLRGDLEAGHDGYAGGTRTSNGFHVRGPFYLPAFDFAPGERLPPLRYLHLWRYDWRHHSAADVAAHWDFRALRTFTYDAAPLRWFLGTLPMADLANLQVLRLDDAEWALHPGLGRQAALMIGELLQHHVRELRCLELIRCYTDCLPLSAVRQHAATLETLVLRHPFGVGGGGTRAGAEMSDAPAANMTPLALYALLVEGSIPGQQAAQLGQGEQQQTGQTGQQQQQTEPTGQTGQQQAGQQAGQTGQTEQQTGQTGQTEQTGPGQAVQVGQAVQGQPFGPLPPAAPTRFTPQQLQEINRLQRRGRPLFSRLHTLELDLDDRHVDPTNVTPPVQGNPGGPPEGPEAEMIGRLARLPNLVNLTLAVPSALRGLQCVPRYDVDLHQSLQRLIYLLGQRNGAQRHRLSEMEWLAGVTGTTAPSYPAVPLRRVAFHIGGWMPRRGARVDESGAVIHRRTPPPPLHLPPSAVPLPGIPLPASEASTPSASSAPSEGSTPPRRPRRRQRRHPSGRLMLSAGTSARAWTAPSFLAESHDLDVTPGVGPALALRALGLRQQRCVVAVRERVQDLIEASDSEGEGEELEGEGEGEGEEVEAGQAGQAGEAGSAGVMDELEEDKGKGHEDEDEAMEEGQAETREATATETREAGEAATEEADEADEEEEDSGSEEEMDAEDEDIGWLPYAVGEEFDLLDRLESRSSDFEFLAMPARHLRVHHPYEVRLGDPQLLGEAPLWDVTGLTVWP